MRDVVLKAFAAYCEWRILTASREQIDEWLDSLGLVPRSRSKYLSHLHNFYVWAIREGLTETDPTVLIPRPKLPKLLPRPIKDADLELALRLAPPKVGAMLSLACYEGLRCHEIAAMETEWLWTAREDPLLIITGKGGKERLVPLAAETELALQRYGLPRSGPVFRSRFNRPYHPVSISNMCSRYLRSKGIDATAHQLRHWFGTEVYRQSRDILLTQELLGHADVSTTRGYVALSPDPGAAEMVRNLSVKRQNKLHIVED